MQGKFSTADELMDHLKKQIISHSRGEEIEEYYQNDVNHSNGTSLNEINLGAFSGHAHLNNNLWNVSANRPITSHRKVTGKFIVSTKRLIRKILKWYVGDTFDHQSAFNVSVTKSFNELNNILIVMTSKLNEQELKINQLESKIDEQKTINSELDIKINKKQVMISSYDSKISELNNKVFELAINYRSIQYRYNEILEKIESGNNSSYYENSEKLAIKKESLLQSEQIFDYVSFENQFRGSREDIKNRQKAYLPYFENKENVLDIGCGRGEFLELLLENGITSHGIDLNTDMVEISKRHGLSVEKADAIGYLKNLEDDSLGGIFLGQVIEHMPFEIIIELVSLAFNKLKTDSYLIMETPNPETLAIFNRFFYVDPTHVKPVHPLTAKFIVESRGFTDVNILYSGPVEEELRIPKLFSESINVENVNEINESIDRLNDLLYGNQDYAIIARK